MSSEANEFLLALWCGADDDKDALLLVLEPSLQMDTIRPHVDVALGREVPALPAFVLVDPDVFQPCNGRG